MAGKDVHVGKKSWRRVCLRCGSTVGLCSSVFHQILCQALATPAPTHMLCNLYYHMKYVLQVRNQALRVK